MIDYNMVDKLKYIAGCFELKRKHERILDRGTAKIDGMLDLRSII